MTKTLCLDFGNSKLKAAIFTGNQLTDMVELIDDSVGTIQSIIQLHQPHKSILSSVINHNIAIEQVLATYTQFHKLSHLSKINFTSPVGKPQSIGADRLALVAAAVHFYPNKNNLVICLGSCITYNFVNQYHQFLGGAISPGANMRFKSMNDYTALLPLVAVDTQFPIIGYDTKTNLQSGVMAGISFEIGGFIEYYQSKYSNFNVVLTGGNSAYFAQRFKNKIFADINFLFKGLFAISEVNNC
jgi:type III pantothenate kinase